MHIALRLSLTTLISFACRPEPETRSAIDTSDPQRSTTTVSSDSFHARADTLEELLCQHLNNSYECAQAIEKHVLVGGKNGVIRRGVQLIIPLAHGETLSLRDSAPQTPDGVWHSYRAYLPSIGYHVVSLQFYEGGGYLLVSGASGKTTFSNGLPVVSPDNRRLAAGNVDLEAEYSPTTIQVWRLEGDSLALEWEHDFIRGGPATDSTWGPSKLRWLTATDIHVTKEYAFGEVRGETIVRLGVNGWGFSPP